MDIYQQLKADPSFTSKLVSGTQTDRFAGLEGVLNLTEGKSVLDIGSHSGMVAFEFARFGARTIHGFDIYQTGIVASECIFDGMGEKFKFHRADLSEGLDAFETKFSNLLLPRYDIVLLLAIFQHLKRQMSPENLNLLFNMLVNLSSDLVVVRTPEYEELGKLIESNDFRLVGFHNYNSNVSPTLVYRRVK